MPDPSTADLSPYALLAAVVPLAAWLAAAWRRRADAGTNAVSLAFLLTACLAMAAPALARLDPSYIGNGFGLPHDGWPVAFAAISVLGIVGAWALLHPERRSAMLIAGGIGFYLFVSLAPPVVTTLFTDPDAFELRLGDYLTVAGNVAVVPALAVIGGYAAAAVWGIAALVAPRNRSA